MLYSSYILKFLEKNCFVLEIHMYFLGVVKKHWFYLVTFTIQWFTIITIFYSVKCQFYLFSSNQFIFSELLFHLFWFDGVFVVSITKWYRTIIKDFFFTILFNRSNVNVKKNARIFIVINVLICSASCPFITAVSWNSSSKHFLFPSRANLRALPQYSWVTYKDYIGRTAYI